MIMVYPKMHHAGAKGPSSLGWALRHHLPHRCLNGTASCYLLLEIILWELNRTLDNYSNFWTSHFLMGNKETSLCLMGSYGLNYHAIHGKSRYQWQCSIWNYERVLNFTWYWCLWHFKFSEALSQHQYQSKLKPGSFHKPAASVSANVILVVAVFFS